MYIDILVIAFTKLLYLRHLPFILCEDKEDLVRKFGTFGALEKGFWCGLQDDFMSFLSSLLCLLVLVRTLGRFYSVFFSPIQAFVSLYTQISKYPSLPISYITSLQYLDTLICIYLYLCIPVHPNIPIYLNIYMCIYLYINVPI